MDVGRAARERFPIPTLPLGEQKIVQRKQRSGSSNRRPDIRAAVTEGRCIQDKIDRRDASEGAEAATASPIMQAGARPYPAEISTAAPGQARTRVRRAPRPDVRGAGLPRLGQVEGHGRLDHRR